MPTQDDSLYKPTFRLKVNYLKNITIPIIMITINNNNNNNNNNNDDDVINN